MSATERSARSAGALALGLLLGAVAGCGWIGGDPRPGIYRAIIDSPAGELPFLLELGATGRDLPEVFLVNGTERLPAERITRGEEALEVLLPGSDATLTFTARGTKLVGLVYLSRQPGDRQSLRFSAENGLAYRFFAESATDNADVAGRWSAVSGSERAMPWLIADLQQSHDQLTGILYGQAGAQQAVTGQVQGDEVRLSSFDGRTALLMVATVNDDGELDGEYWSSQTGSAQLSATRNPDAEIGSVADVEPIALR